MARAIALLREGGLDAVAEQEPSIFVRYNRGLLALLIRDLGRQPAIDPNDRSVVLVYGPTGVGKSASARVDLRTGVRLRRGVDYAVNPLGTGGWFDGYLGQRTFIFEDFSGAASHVSLNDLLRLLDVYDDFMVPVKNAFVPWRATTIVITCNNHPRDWYDYTNRQEQYRALARRFTHVRAYNHRRQVYYVERPPYSDPLGEDRAGLPLSTELRTAGVSPISSQAELEALDAEPWRPTSGLAEHLNPSVWERFWSGPESVIAPLPMDDRMGVYVARSAEQNKYDFMFQ